MDLRKVPDEEKVQLCKRYFFVGFALLPFLWFVNFIWFFKYAFSSGDVAEGDTTRKDLKKYTAMSGIGALLWIIGLISWNAYFQSNRASLSWGDSMSFIMPIGRP